MIASGDWAGIITAVGGLVTVVGGFVINIVMTLKQNKVLKEQNVKLEEHTNQIRSDIADVQGAVTGTFKTLPFKPDQK